jgi:hypothetical protein
MGLDLGPTDTPAVAVLEGGRRCAQIHARHR